MKRTKLNIKTSEQGNLEYFVYRGTTQEEVPADLNALSALTPILSVKEDEVQHEAAIINETIDVDVTKVPLSDQIPYALSFEPLKDGIHYVEIKITHVNPDSGDTPVPMEKMVMINFTAEGIPEEVLLTNEGEEAVDITTENVIHFLNKTIFIKDDLTENSTSIDVKYFMRVVNVYDDDIKIQEGVNYDGPVGTGLPQPVIAFSKDFVPKASGTLIPIALMQMTGGTAGEVYYYRIVGKDPVGNLTDPSGLFSVHLSQSNAEIQYSIEESDDGIIWNHLLMAEDMEVIEYGKEGTIMFDNFGSLLADGIRQFYENETIVDTSSVNVDNQIRVTIPNVWKDDDNTYRTRNTKQFRAKVVDTYSQESQYSEPTMSEEIIIPIEKIVVMKKLVTSLDLVDQSNPIEMDDADATMIKEWIRKAGHIYVPADHVAMPLNVRESSSPTVVFDDLTSFPTITLIDVNALPAEVYNYTIYLIDAYGDVSVPLVLRAVS